MFPDEEENETGHDAFVIPSSNLTRPKRGYCVLGDGAPIRTFRNLNKARKYASKKYKSVWVQPKTHLSGLALDRLMRSRGIER